ncbi:MAG: T9SS type A sorting domain-containing protein, partial [Bacteroidetes bacterium]|nr:T9SS type A sorting domain-containing protein [Bacteroidota bacterium]
NVNIDEAEPEILLTSCIHGDETHPEQVMMKLARELCLKYNYDPQITNLLNTREIWIIAVINTDGLRGINWYNRPNANGVDLNRNFGYMWNAQGSDPYEYSEPETKAVRDFILSRNFNVMIDYHSGLQGIIYPWYYKTDNCPDFPEISYLANQYDIESAYPEDEFAVTCGADLYVTNGTMAEFAYGSLGIHAFAVELTTFSSILNSCELLTINKPSILMMIQKAGEGIGGKVTNATTELPIQAKVEVEGRVPSYTGMGQGDYHRFLLAGDYTVTASASGYNSQVMTVSVSDGELTTQDFELTPADRFASQKLLICRNYNNTSDPAETWKALGLNDNQSYAIGNTGYVVLDMGVPINDIVGDDITVHGSASASGNGYELFHSSSVDGPWVSLGTGNTTKSFELNGVSGARYFRLEDNGVGPSRVVGAGFNLDAVIASDIITRVESISYAESVYVYPNPTKGIVYIGTKGSDKITEIRVLNMNGELLMKDKFSNSLNLEFLPAGVYFIQLYTNTTIFTHKIIKQ